jgi:hypothetical protein
VQIVGKQEIDLTAGDDIMLVPMTNASVRSIDVRVLKGQVAVAPIPSAHDSETGELVGGTVLTSQSGFSVSTGKIDNGGDVDNSMDQPFDVTPPLDSDE